MFVKILFTRMFVYTFVLCLCLSSTGALHAEETLIDEQLAAIPFIRQLVERIGVLESRDRNQQELIDKLEAEVDTQRKEILQLRSSVETKDLRVLELINGVRKQNKEKDESIGQTEKSTVIKRAGDATARIRRAQNEVTVAFSTGLTQSVQHAGENQNVVFNYVETNVGNGYNSHHGVFTAPVAGIYVFTTSIMTTSGRKICEIVVNGTRKAQVYTHGDGHYDHGTQTVIVHLKKGDDAAIQTIEPNYDNTIYGQIPPFTTFSGFLLQQDFSEIGSIVG